MAEPLPGHTCGTPPSMSCSACMDLYADPGDPGPTEEEVRRLPPANLDCPRCGSTVSIELDRVAERAWAACPTCPATWDDRGKEIR